MRSPTVCLNKNPKRFLVVFFSDGWAEVTDEATLEAEHRIDLIHSKSSYLVVDHESLNCRSVVAPKTAVARNLE